MVEIFCLQVIVVCTSTILSKSYCYNIVYLIVLATKIFLKRDRAKKMQVSLFQKWYFCSSRNSRLVFCVLAVSTIANYSRIFVFCSLRWSSLHEGSTAIRITKFYTNLWHNSNSGKLMGCKRASICRLVFRIHSNMSVTLFNVSQCHESMFLQYNNYLKDYRCES